MHWFVAEIMLEVFRCCCSPKKMLVTITFTVLQLKTKKFHTPAAAALSLSLRLLALPCPCPCRPCHVNWQRSAAPFMSQNTRIQWSDKTRPMNERAYDQWPDPTRPCIYMYCTHIWLDWWRCLHNVGTGGIDTVLSNVIQLPAPSQIPQEMNVRHGIACNHFCGNYPTAWSGQCLELSCWLDKVDKVGLQHPTSGTRHRLWLSDWLRLWYIIYYI